MSLTLDYFSGSLLNEFPLLQALSRRPRTAPRLTISLPNDLAIYHSDIYKHNFLYDATDATTRPICIVDFQHIGVFPTPFQTFGFFYIENPFAAAVGTHLGYERSDIANTLGRASVLLQQISGAARLGKRSSSVTSNANTSV